MSPGLDRRAGAGPTPLLLLYEIVAEAIGSPAVGVGAGLAASVVRSRLLDTVLRMLSLVGLAAPGALVGLVLILTVALNGGMLPAGGWSDSFPDNIRFLILPSVTVSVWLAPIIFRAVRERASAVLGEPFVEAAVVRGHPKIQIVVRHVVPNCVGPVLTVIAASLSYLISGAVIVEIIFGLPGIGRALTTAVGSSDFPVIQGIVLATGAAVVIINLGAEIVSRAIDPRTGAL
ncbi:ABC transporter permease [Skermania sp. ID1734]|uniref:ABC transporter permease n=1 Tax=Skermania sp. ID1734 TaxID=2597516 RepID=UPI002106FCE2|nr:ABC transporter permease [Skermania sp. ID1734]